MVLSMSIARIVRILVVAGIVWLIFYCTTISSVFMQTSSLPVPQSMTTSAEPSDSQTIALNPARLVIPTIELKAEVVAVGKTASGNMAVPHNFVQVGWYREGIEPGEKGNAVIAGHVDNGLGRAAVFKRLSELKVGDKIYVQDKTGEQLQFKVTETAIYDYKTAPLEKIFGPSDKAHLNLITCAGVWVPREKTNDKRLVVFSELVSGK